jgi:hypothetical protein
MTKDVALEHLRNVLRVRIPDLKRLVRDTEQRVLGEAAARGRTYDPAIASQPARTFLTVIRDTLNGGLEEAKRIFSMPGMPTDSSTKAEVKNILSELASQFRQSAEQSLNTLGKNLGRSERPGPLVPEIDKLSAAVSSEIDLLFHAKSVELPAVELLVFISASSKNLKVADAILRLLKDAFGLRAAQIRYTSHPAYGLSGGANPDMTLRQEVVKAKLVVGLITPKASALNTSYSNSALAGAVRNLSFPYSRAGRRCPTFPSRSVLMH